MIYRPFQKDFLRLHAKEITLLQKIIDIVIILSLYSFLLSFNTFVYETDFQNSLLVLAVLLHICLNSFGLYKSYRSKSLVILSFTIFYIWLFWCKKVAIKENKT